MFQWIHAIRFDPDGRAARARAVVPADATLFGDHFPSAPVLPGSIAIELAAQVAGPLAEQLAGQPSRRWAALGMVRSAKFLRPIALPASLELAARILRVQNTSVTVHVVVDVDGSPVAHCDVVMVLLDRAPGAAIADRDARVARWQQAWEAE